jgi:hypothetical protein
MDLPIPTKHSSVAHAQHALHKEFMAEGERKNFDNEKATVPKKDTRGWLPILLSSHVC